MSDPTNDIDALLRFLEDRPHRPRWHSAITALVAERDELQRRNDALRKAIDACVKMNTEVEKRVAAQDAAFKTLAASNAILHGRIYDADAAIAAMRKGVARE